MLKLHLILSLTLITLSIQLDVNELKTEPYVEFDWLDEDKKSLSVEFYSPPSVGTCCLYNGTQLCVAASCNPATNTLTCEFEGDKCKADGDNPGVKYYYRLFCDDTNCATGKESNLKEEGNEDVYVTVAVLNSGFIKVWFTFIFCLLVF